MFTTLYSYVVFFPFQMQYDCIPVSYSAVMTLLGSKIVILHLICT